jgi:hypothetical protein
MVKFLKEFFWLVLPLFIWSLIVYLIDPFNYFNSTSLIDITIKENNSQRINGILYKVIDYYHHPCENILIGDSRIGALPITEIEKISELKFKKLVIEAAKLNEIFDLIYLANSRIKLKNVVIGINFTLLNEFSYADRVKNVKEILKNPLRYIFNRNIAESCYYIIKSIMLGENISTKPAVSKDEWWQDIIKVKAFDWYGKFSYSEKLIEGLVTLDKFARENNINLTLIVVPLHSEFRKKLYEFGRTGEEEKFKITLKSLHADVFDYDYPNDITNNKENYNDPVHYNADIGKLIVNEIWNNNLIIGRDLKKYTIP